MLTVCSWRWIQFSYHPIHLNEATVVFGYLSTAHISHLYRKSFSKKGIKRHHLAESSKNMITHWEGIENWPVTEQSLLQCGQFSRHFHHCCLVTAIPLLPVVLVSRRPKRQANLWITVASRCWLGIAGGHHLPPQVGWMSLLSQQTIAIHVWMLPEACCSPGMEGSSGSHVPKAGCNSYFFSKPIF